MDSLTDERNLWFNAVRLEDSHDYSSAALAYLEDASRCLSRGFHVRAAMSSAAAAGCLANMADTADAVDLYSATASLYELNADISMEKSIRESLWSLLHSFEYFTLVSDHVNAERASKKYADLARRVDRFETRSVFEALKTRRENVLDARSSLSLQPAIRVKDIPNINRIQRSTRAFLQQVQTATLALADSGALEQEEEETAGKLERESVEEAGLVYESEPEINERRFVS